MATELDTSDYEDLNASENNAASMTASQQAELNAIFEEAEREKAERADQAKKAVALQQAKSKVVATKVKTKSKEKKGYQRVLSALKAPESGKWAGQADKDQTKATLILENFDVLRFYQRREADPIHFTYTPEGNLEIKGVGDPPDSVIRLSKKFEPLTEAEYVEYMSKRSTTLKEREKAYESAISNLRAVLQDYTAGVTSASAVVDANSAVLLASQLRSQVAYPEKWIDTVENPVTQDILMMYAPYETRKLGYDAYLFKQNEMPAREAWGHYVERGAGGAGEEQLGGATRIRFLTDSEDETTGHFHPFYQRNFNFNETEYCCVYQAYHGERFKELGKEDLRNQVLGTRSGRTIHAIALKDKTLINAPQQLWEDIVFQFFYQHPDVRKELDATGTDKFHVMDKEIPADYGTVLEKARLRLRELGDNELDHQEVKEHVITEGEQKKAKVGAIIHNFKKRF